MSEVIIKYNDEDGRATPVSLDYTTPISMIEVVGLLEWAKIQVDLKRLPFKK